MKNAVINLSICLTDIPKDKIKQSEKNGKLYLSITVKGRKEPDTYGNDVYAIVSQSKEEREAQAGKIYIATGNYIEFSGNTPEYVASMPPANNATDDLPF